MDITPQELRKRLIELAIKEVHFHRELLLSPLQAEIKAYLFALNTTGTDSLESPLAQQYTQTLANRDAIHTAADALVEELRGLMSRNLTPTLNTKE